MTKKKMILLLFFIPLLLQAQDTLQTTGVLTMQTLFDSLKTHPQTRADELNMEKALIGKRIVSGMLYPKINAFGRYEYASTPSGMLPLAPNDLFGMIKDQTIPQPFSQNIFRIGAGVTMPVFAMSIYSTVARAKMIYHSAEAKAWINIQKNEALIVSSNSNLLYLNSLLKSLEKKRASLAKTKESVELQVKNGRAPKSALLKIRNAMNEVSILENNIRGQRERAIATIRSLTGITLDIPVEMVQTGTYQAYNNDLYLNEDFGTLALTLNIPIFTKSQYARIKKAKLDYQSSENDLNKMENNLPLLNNSIKLYKQSIEDKKELLKIAKTAYLSQRMTVEDYLKYEDDLVLEESKLYKTQAKKWQTLMQLAVIYGNDIEQIVK